MLLEDHVLQSEPKKQLKLNLARNRHITDTALSLFCMRLLPMADKSSHVEVKTYALAVCSIHV